MMTRCSRQDATKSRYGFGVFRIKHSSTRSKDIPTGYAASRSAPRGVYWHQGQKMGQFCCGAWQEGLLPRSWRAIRKEWLRWSSVLMDNGSHQEAKIIPYASGKLLLVACN